DAGIIGGLTNTTFDPDAITSGQAATEDQLKQVSGVANAGWNVSDGTSTHNIGPDGKVTFSGDNNLTVTESGSDDDAEVAITLNDDIDVDSVTAGNSTLDTTGLTVDDGNNKTVYGPNGVDINGGDITLTDEGLDNGGQTITGVSDGAINSGSDEAINGSQLQTGNDSLAGDVLGGDAVYDGNTNSWDMGSDIGG